MARDPAEEERLLRAELERLRKELANLEVQWKKKYRLAVLAVLAVPVYFFAGVFWAVATVVFLTPALIATQAYLLYVRRAEVHTLMIEMKEELAALRKEAKAEAAASAPAEPAAG